jgi:lipoprotein-anchoring transpeptidase ErfK/SrfK
MTRNTLLVGATVVALGHSVWTTREALQSRFERDVARMVFNDNLDALKVAERDAGVELDSLESILSTTSMADPDTAPYIVVSIAERRLWFRQGDSVLFTTQVATGSGKTLVTDGGVKSYRFETPRGRLVVQRKDSAPAWIPPDWHYAEQAKKRGLGVTQLMRGQTLRASDGSELAVSGSEVVRRSPDGRQTPVTATDGREIVFDGKIIIPPFGTNQRKYKEVLGTHRLYLGDGYALHGTNNPSSIGQAVSHGCVRLRNEDIAFLYDVVPVGTPVYIY